MNRPQLGRSPAISLWMKSLLLFLSTCFFLDAPLFAQIDATEGAASFLGYGAVGSSTWEEAYFLHGFGAKDGTLFMFSGAVQPEVQDQEFDRVYLGFGLGKIYETKGWLPHPFWNIGLGFRADVHTRLNENEDEELYLKDWRFGPTLGVGLVESVISNDGVWEFSFLGMVVVFGSSVVGGR